MITVPDLPMAVIERAPSPHRWSVYAITMFGKVFFVKVHDSVFSVRDRESVEDTVKSQLTFTMLRFIGAA